MTFLKAGQPAPEFALHSVEGEKFSLSDLKDSDQHTLIVFLRHLG